MPDRAEFHHSLARTQRFTRGDPRLPPMEALARGMASLPPQGQAHLSFALGKAYAELGEHDRAFGHYRHGNAVVRGTMRYDEAAALDFLRRIKQQYTPDLVAAKQGQGGPSRLPVFIVGMPRSGSTLVEQILAHHPQVRGAGELKAFGQGMAALGYARSYPENLPAMTSDHLRRLGERYVAALQGIAGRGAARITDKMPTNFLFVGLIHLALPNAAIIHTVRDPVDCCLSNFTTLFAPGRLAHSYDLGELGRYHRACDTLMRHWHALLPGVMLEIHYEDLVADLEAGARRIVAHAGLPWDDACLRFHEPGRLVQTASARQVRHPIYASSVGRWRDYKDHLAPLLRELGPSA